MDFALIVLLPFSFKRASGCGFVVAFLLLSSSFSCSGSSEKEAIPVEGGREEKTAESEVSSLLMDEKSSPGETFPHGEKFKLNAKGVRATMPIWAKNSEKVLLAWTEKRGESDSSSSAEIRFIVLGSEGALAKVPNRAEVGGIMPEESTSLRLLDVTYAEDHFVVIGAYEVFDEKVPTEGTRFFVFQIDSNGGKAEGFGSIGGEGVRMCSMVHPYNFGLIPNSAIFILKGETLLFFSGSKIPRNKRSRPRGSNEERCLDGPMDLYLIRIGENQHAEVHRMSDTDDGWGLFNWQAQKGENGIDVKWMESDSKKRSAEHEVTLNVSVSEEGIVLSDKKKIPRKGYISCMKRRRGLWKAYDAKLKEKKEEALIVGKVEIDAGSMIEISLHGEPVKRRGGEATGDLWIEYTEDGS